MLTPVSEIRRYRNDRYIIINTSSNETKCKHESFQACGFDICSGKVYGEVVCTQLVASVAHRMDPLQFASKASKGAEGACLVLVNLIASHRDLSGSYLVVIARTSEHRPLIHFRPTFLFKGFWI